MRRFIYMLIVCLFFLSACTVPPGQIKKQAAPGQIKKTTGEHPVSGKEK